MFQTIKKQRNHVVNQNNLCKKDRFDRANPEKDSKPFSKSCKPYFLNKHYFEESKIALSENGELLNENNNEIAKTFNSFFEIHLIYLVGLQKLVLVMIRLNFTNHPSIQKIKEIFQLNERFFSTMFLSLL